MKEENIKRIGDFISDRDLFFGKIHDSALFDKDEFHKYVRAVYDLSKEKLSCEEKYKTVIVVWEVSYKIQEFLGSHLDPNDYFHLDNLEEDDIRQISNILYYTANWFSYGKEMEEDSITIGSWA